MALVSYVKDILIIGLASALLWHFSNILRFGSHIIQEPNQVILISEVAALVMILAFGLFMAALDCREKDKWPLKH